MRPKTHVIIVWGMDALVEGRARTRTFEWMGIGCAGNRMHVNDLGMDALGTESMLLEGERYCGLPEPHMYVE